MPERSALATIVGLFVIAAATATLVKGLQLTRFETAGFASAQRAREAALAYSHSLGLQVRAARALTPQESLRQATPESIESVLLVEPTNGVYWLALAESWQDGGAEREKVLAALRMSEAVEPREAASMARRATFVLSLWDQMPVSERERAIGDLVELGARLPADDRALIAGVLKDKPDEIRSAVREALREKSALISELTGFGL